MEMSRGYNKSRCNSRGRLPKFEKKKRGIPEFQASHGKIDWKPRGVNSKG